LNRQEQGRRTKKANHACRPPSCGVDDPAFQPFTWLDSEADVLPEERVVDAKVVQTWLHFHFDTVAKEKNETPLAIDAHEYLTITTIGRVVSDERDKGSEVVGRRGFRRRGGRSAGRPESGCDGHVHRVTPIGTRSRVSSGLEGPQTHPRGWSVWTWE
jgi:hypothetical protein